MNTSDYSNPATVVVLRLEERNRIAQKLIDDYIAQHTAMDITLGLTGIIFPGAAIPALMVAITAQAPLIYQPLAKKLCRLYQAHPDELEMFTDDTVPKAWLVTSTLDITADFGVEFIKAIAFELLGEAGIGAILTACIPIIGGVAAAGLDYMIAKEMTTRVGRMVSIYFQNGGEWVGSKQSTYTIAKNMSNVESLDDIRKRQDVRQALLRNVQIFVNMMRHGMTTEQIRKVLRNQGVPDDLIEEALK